MRDTTLVCFSLNATAVLDPDAHQRLDTFAVDAMPVAAQYSAHPQQPVNARNSAWIRRGPPTRLQHVAPRSTSPLSTTSQTIGDSTQPPHPRCFVRNPSGFGQQPTCGGSARAPVCVSFIGASRSSCRVKGCWLMWVLYCVCVVFVLCLVWLGEHGVVLLRDHIPFRFGRRYEPSSQRQVSCCERGDFGSRLSFWGVG